MDTRIPIETEIKNYSIAQDLAKKYDLADMERIYNEYRGGVESKEVADLKKENAQLKEQLKHSYEADMAMFETKERAVKDIPGIRVTKEELAKRKSVVLHNYCMQDGKYALLYTNYRTMVEDEYKKKEGVKDELLPPTERNPY